MAKRNLALWIGSGALVAVSALAMVWIWRSGGVTLGSTAHAEPSVEECGATISGSSAMTARLAPDIAERFLARSGYEVAKSAADGETRVVGARGDLKCTIVIRPSTSSEALHDLAQNRTLIALSQRPITRKDIDTLSDAGAGDFDEYREQAEHVVGFDVYSVVVNAGNDVRSINYDALREIVFGQTSNWNQLGGADAPITLYSPRDGVGPEDYPNDLVQNANPAWINAVAGGRILKDEAEVAAAVGADPNALAFMSAAFVTPRTRTLDIAFAGDPRAATAANVLSETYPMTRRLFAYVRPADMEANAFARRFIEFFQSPEAFDAVEAAGFVALRPTSRMSAVARNLSGCRFGTAEYAALMSATRNARRESVELHFNPQTTIPDGAARQWVSANAERLRTQLREGAAVILIGHSDYSGDVAENRALALRRALAVRGAFEARGVLGLEVESAGEVCPAGDNDTQEGRERNRRVEVWVRQRLAQEG